MNDEDVSCLQIMKTLGYCCAGLITRESHLTQLMLPAFEVSVGGQTVKYEHHTKCLPPGLWKMLGQVPHH